MATELVVLKTDVTSLFVDGAIDANIIDASFYIMAENKSKTGQQQNLFLPSFIFVSAKQFSLQKFVFVRFDKYFVNLINFHK